MKRWLIGVLFLVPSALWAQQPDTLHLAACYQMARLQEPLLKRNPILAQQLEWKLKDLKSKFLPEISAGAQATYQSDVTSIPFKLPNLQVPSVPKDQYKAILDLNQLILDGGRIRSQMKVAEASSRLLQGQQDVAYHALKSQVMSLFEAILIADANLRSLKVKQHTLDQQLRRMGAEVINGNGLPSSVDELKAARLELNQHILMVAANRRSALKALSLMTGQEWPDTIELAVPKVVWDISDTVLQRPELQVYRLKDQLLDQQLLQTHTLNHPYVYGFVGGGYGRPGLNMLSNQFEGYYIAGLRLNWTLLDWGTRRRSEHILEADRQLNALDREHFTQQTTIELDQDLETIQALLGQLASDQDLVRLRTAISQTASSQLAQGVITPTEYLIQLQDETQAQITLDTHRLQLTFAQLHYQLLKSL